MSTKHKAPQGQPWKTDELGIVTWAKGTDPYDEIAPALAVMQAPTNLQLAVSQLHINLCLARSVALSVFGTEWDEYVLDVYDRLKDLKDDFDHADDPPEPGEARERAPYATVQRGTTGNGGG